MSEIKSYRHKSPVVEAWQFDGSPTEVAKVVTWLPKTAEYHHALMDGVLVAHPDPYLRIPINNGNLIVSKGDWLVKTPDRQLSVVKPHTFAQTYEAVIDDEI